MASAVSVASQPQPAGCANSSRLRHSDPAPTYHPRLLLNHTRARFPRRRDFQSLHSSTPFRSFRGVNVRCDVQEPASSHGSRFANEEESVLKEELRKATRFEKRLEARVGVPQEPEVFTGDELHYVETSDGWRLALWRYLPSDSVPRKAHPVLLLSGIATNALGYDLSEEVSLARHLSKQGFDTWILELRGAGLSQSPFSIAASQGLTSAKSSAAGSVEGPPITFINGSVNGTVNSAINGTKVPALNGSINGTTNGAVSNELADEARNGLGASSSSSSSPVTGLSNGSVFTPLFSSDDEDSTAAAAEVARLTVASSSFSTPPQAAPQAAAVAPAAAEIDVSEGASSIIGSLSRTMHQLRSYLDQFASTALVVDPEILRPKLKFAERKLREYLSQGDSHGGSQQHQQQFQQQFQQWGWQKQHPSMFEVHLLLVELQSYSDLMLMSSGMPRLWQALDSFFSDEQSFESSPETSPEGSSEATPEFLEALKELHELASLAKAAKTHSLETDTSYDPQQQQQQQAARGPLQSLWQEAKPALPFPTGALSFLQQITRLLSDSITASNLDKRLSDLQKRLGEILTESRQAEFLAAATPAVADLYEQLIGVILQTQDVASMAREYNWDFDTYLYDDVPAAMRYVRECSRPQDGKILAVGHSMGGILLYSRMAALGPDAGLAGVVTVASSLEYWMANTSLKLLRPLAGPARALNFPVIPVAVLAKAALPLMTQPPAPLAWVGHQISARDAMDAGLFSKLLLNNFCTIPVKLLLQMESIFNPGGLRSRSGSISYLKGLRDCQTPILALAGDADSVCPPLLVTETLKAIPPESVEYRLFGSSDNRRYGHYDLLVGKHASEEVFPVISEFLVRNDSAKTEQLVVAEDDSVPSTLSGSVF